MKTYYKISEISKSYNTGQNFLRYHKELGTFHPMRDRNNYRQYTTNDIHRLNMIHDLCNLGFSVKSIQDYLENRTITNSPSLTEEEERIANQKIQELHQLKVDVLHRKALLEACQQLPMEAIELIRLPQCKCIILKTDAVRDDVEYRLVKLSKEYEGNIYTTINFNAGFFLDASNHRHIHASSIFIAEGSLQNWELIPPAGTYLNLYYQGARDKVREHLKRMLKHYDGNGYVIGRHIMEFFVINTYEAYVQEEYITQLQIELENIQIAGIRLYRIHNFIWLFLSPFPLASDIIQEELHRCLLSDQLHNYLYPSLSLHSIVLIKAAVTTTVCTQQIKALNILLTYIGKRSYIELFADSQIICSFIQDEE